jgi:hypothetical protein
VFGDTEFAQVVERHVDAPASRVFTDVLQMLYELESNADLVRPLRSLGRCHVEDREHESTNRGRRQHAVTHEVIESLVAGHSLIHTIGFDEVAERFETQVEVEYDGGESLKDWMNSATFAGEAQLIIEPIEQRQTITVRFIANVVSEASETVDSHELGANRTRQKVRRDWKILATGLDRKFIASAEKTIYRLRQFA